MSKFLKKILDFLPFDGSKFKAGALIALLGAISQLLPNVDLSMLLDMVKSNSTTSGLILAVIGLLHKKLKEEYGTSK